MPNFIIDTVEWFWRLGLEWKIVVIMAALYALWFFYLAVMALQRSYEDGTITHTALLLGVPILLGGLLLDFFINIVLGSVVFLDWPQEYTLSKRLSRLVNEGNENIIEGGRPGYRAVLADWIGRTLLNSFSPRGNHIPLLQKEPSP